MNQPIIKVDEWNVEFEVLAAVVMKSYNSMWTVENQLILRRNFSLPSSGLNHKLSKKLSIFKD
jgi:hypothetical protein